ncbi:MAG TPA: aminotransferase class I/II-fold pyridoxal phosphate-dependent enzyme [Thermoanaerobaculia bacterium]|nr:aminotransferase class I/II-fold pyridoxal phosphate-dependent enzyme [Thermoanaerobaculia bacterium]
MHFETTVIHAGMHIDDETGAVALPIHLSTTFERSAAGDTPRGFSYIRDGNPTQMRLEEALAAIDSGERALVFASGMAAGTALLQALPAGAHVILPDDSYYSFRATAAEFFPKWKMTFDVAPMEDLDRVRQLMRNETKLIWIESPSNPLMKVVDIRALCNIARERGAASMVDGTFASPALQRPIELGADIVLHSTTKYLGGHTDVQGGALIFARHTELLDRAESVRHLIGGVASPFNSWLVLRGIRSLSVRMRAHSENGMAIARFLAKHPRVEAVYYPGLESHPRYDIARRQMSAFGGMLSFLVRGGRAEALAVAAKTKLFTRATSLGGVESLIEHRASSEGPTSTTPQNLLRMSIGLEHAADLVEDLRQALE